MSDKKSKPVDLKMGGVSFGPPPDKNPFHAPILQRVKPEDPRAHQAIKLANDRADAWKAIAGRLAEALNVYLMAGHKDARREASIQAKQAIAEFNKGSCEL